jgi:hypothetical protein
VEELTWKIEDDCLWLGDKQKGMQWNKDGIFFWKNGVATKADENIVNICPCCGANIDKTE